MAWLQIAGAAIGIASSIFGGKKSSDAQKDAAAAERLSAEEQAKEFRITAEQVRRVSALNAMRIRRDALTLRAEQIATAAHNGILLGDGTSTAMAARTMALAKQDMLVTYYEGQMEAQALERKAETAIKTGIRQSEALMSQAKATRVGSFLDAAVTGLSFWNKK